jgi:hypothetical protein
MGSGVKNRKKSDRIFIKSPLAGAFGGISAGPGGHEVCLPSFEVKVAKTNLTVEDMTVRLEKKNDRYILVIGANDIGKLSEKLSDMVLHCSDLGIKYLGKIVFKNESPYARFDRISG